MKRAPIRGQRATQPQRATTVTQLLSIAAIVIALSGAAYTLADRTRGGDLIPSLDNTFTIGNKDFRWKDLQLGPGTLYIQDQVRGTQTALNVIDGALLLDGADSLRIGNVRLTAEGLESIESGQDINIGNFGDTGYALFPTGIKFSDGSTMTSAADLGVAGTGGARGPRG